MEMAKKAEELARAISGKEPAAKPAVIKDGTSLKDKLNAYGSSRTSTNGLIEAAGKITETLAKIIGESTTMGEVDFYVHIVKGIKKVPVEKKIRDANYAEFYNNDASKQTAPAKEWAKCAEILDSLNAAMPTNNYLSNAAICVALEGLCTGMCEQGLKHPEAHGWFVMAKGPYHFVTFQYAMDTTWDYLIKAIKFIRKFDSASLESLIKFDKNARPTRTATELLETIKSKTVEPDLVNAMAVNPAYWRFAYDMRKRVDQGGLSDGKKRENETILLTMCEGILELGAKMKSPALKAFQAPKGMISPAKLMFARLANVLADIQFIISFIKAPIGTLGSKNKGLKNEDDLAYAAFQGMEMAKSGKLRKMASESLFAGMKFTLTFNEKNELVDASVDKPKDEKK